MINAISCYYCSTTLHGNHCNDPFLTNNSNYMTTFNSSYKACAVKKSYIFFFFDYFCILFFLHRKLFYQIFMEVQSFEDHEWNVLQSMILPVLYGVAIAIIVITVNEFY